MVGMERTIPPALVEHAFHLAAKTAVLSFIVVFGITKAFTNYLAGRLSDRFGCKHMLVAAPLPFRLSSGTTSWEARMGNVAANLLCAHVAASGLCGCTDNSSTVLHDTDLKTAGSLQFEEE